MKKIDYMKPAMRVRQLYLEGSVMDGLPMGSPGQEMDDDEGMAKDADFEDGLVIPSSKSVWDD